MGVSRGLFPKMTSVAGEEVGMEAPAQLKGLLQLLFAVTGKADAPVQVAAKHPVEIDNTAAASAATVFAFNMNASVPAGLRSRSAAAWPRSVQEQPKN